MARELNQGSGLGLPYGIVRFWLACPSGLPSAGDETAAPIGVNSRMKLKAILAGLTSTEDERSDIIVVNSRMKLKAILVSGPSHLALCGYVLDKKNEPFSVPDHPLRVHSLSLASGDGSMYILVNTCQVHRGLAICVDALHRGSSAHKVLDHVQMSIV